MSATKDPFGGVDDDFELDQDYFDSLHTRFFSPIKNSAFHFQFSGSEKSFSKSSFQLQLGMYRSLLEKMRNISLVGISEANVLLGRKKMALMIRDVYQKLPKVQVISEDEFTDEAYYSSIDLLLFFYLMKFEFNSAYDGVLDFTNETKKDILISRHGVAIFIDFLRVFNIFGLIYPGFQVSMISLMKEILSPGSLCNDSFASEDGVMIESPFVTALLCEIDPVGTVPARGINLIPSSSEEYVSHKRIFLLLAKLLATFGGTVPRSLGAFISEIGKTPFISRTMVLFYAEEIRKELQSMLDVSDQADLDSSEITDEHDVTSPGDGPPKLEEALAYSLDGIKEMVRRVAPKVKETKKESCGIENLCDPSKDINVLLRQAASEFSPENLPQEIADLVKFMEEKKAFDSVFKNRALTNNVSLSVKETIGSTPTLDLTAVEISLAEQMRNLQEYKKKCREIACSGLELDIESFIDASASGWQHGDIFSQPTLRQGKRVMLLIDSSGSMSRMHHFAKKVFVFLQRAFGRERDFFFRSFVSNGDEIEMVDGIPSCARGNTPLVDSIFYMLSKFGYSDLFTSNILLVFSDLESNHGKEMNDENLLKMRILASQMRTDVMFIVPSKSPLALLKMTKKLFLVNEFDIDHALSPEVHYLALRQIAKKFICSR